MTARNPADIASALLDRGLAVVPMWSLGPDGSCSCGGRCNGDKPGRHPRWTAGNAATSFAAVADWWADNPGDRVGIDRVTSRIITVGDDGQADEWARAEGIELPPTFTIRTPSGRLHRHYRLPENTPTGNHIEPGGLKVDVLSKGRAPGPGVARPDGTYEVADDREVAPAHPSLVAWQARMMQARAEVSTDAVEGEPVEAGALPGWLAERFTAEAPTDRSAAFHGLVGACRDAGLTQGQAVTLMAVWPHTPERYGDRLAAEVARSWGKVDGVVPAVAGTDLEYEQLVAFELRRMFARDQARRIFNAEGAGNRERPRPVSLTELLAAPEQEVDYRIKGLWPAGGTVVMAATKKAGKTTMVGNLVRSLVDGDHFLAAFLVKPVSSVVLVDNEHDPNTLRRWLADQGIVNTDAVRIVSLRGNVSTFDLLDPTTRAEWAAELAGADVVILDCLRPVLDALGLDENRDAGRFLVAFEELGALAGVGESLVVHHMGHTGERSRGDSRIRDWPYAEWKLTQEVPDKGEPDPAGPRFFSAYGRDVEVGEGQLTYDPATRRLTFTGGTRIGAKRARVRREITEYLTANPGAGVRAIQTAVPGGSNAIAEELAAMVTEGIIRVEDQGPGKSKPHYLGSPSQPSPEAGDSTPATTVTDPYRGGGGGSTTAIDPPAVTVSGDGDGVPPTADAPTDDREAGS